MAIKGKYTYNGIEIGNLSLGQNGFKLIVDGTAAEGKFCAIKNVTRLDLGGDDDGSTPIAIGWVNVTVDTSGPNPLTGATFCLGAGDIVYGPFSKVTMTLANSEKILVYYG